MRDGSGNKLSPEEEQKVKSIQGAPDKESVSGISIKPNAAKDAGATNEPPAKPLEKPAAGAGE